MDDLEGPDVRLAVSSVPLDQGQTAEEWAISWCTLYSDPGTDCATAPTRWPRVVVGSASGWVDWDGTATGASVAEGGRLFEAVVVSGGRGYSFSLDGAHRAPVVRGADGVGDVRPVIGRRRLAFAAALAVSRHRR